MQHPELDSPTVTGDASEVAGHDHAAFVLNNTDIIAVKATCFGQLLCMNIVQQLLVTLPGGGRTVGCPRR